jgi:hypothetical protein
MLLCLIMVNEKLSLVRKAPLKLCRGAGAGGGCFYSRNAYLWEKNLHLHVAQQREVLK